VTMPLKNIRVLDFSSLLPGPLATLWLLQAGAEVIKIEHPEGGDEMRQLDALLGEPGHIFEMLNRGKRSIAINLKEAGAIEKLAPLIRESDILVEQFRPGVMERLGLGYQSLKAINPGLIYCSITGYGQEGENSDKAGHDINYQAESGLLELSVGPEGQPVLPPLLAADIAGGSWPAVMNIMLALYAREQTGEGNYLDISMTNSLDPFLFWAKAMTVTRGKSPEPGRELFTGGSPRYQLYQTKDDRTLAVGAIEERFWRDFCNAISLPKEQIDDTDDPEGTLLAVRQRVSERTGSEWESVFAGRDLCCSLVVTVKELCQKSGSIDFKNASGLKSKESGIELPLAPAYHADNTTRSSPALGEDNSFFLV